LVDIKINPDRFFLISWRVTNSQH